MDLTADRTIIHHLRVQAPPGGANDADALDALALRQRCDSALGLVDLRPSSLAPGAILYVRRVRIPAPLAAGRQAGVAEALAWGGAVSQELERLARSAARPVLGAPPAGVEAVLFAGPAEHLACLARDWLDGLLAVNWWWRALLADSGGQQRAAVLRAWLGSPPAVPGALAVLAGRGSAARFAARLTTDEARAGLAGMAAWFGLDARQLPDGPGSKAPGEGQGARPVALHLVSRLPRGARRGAAARERSPEGAAPPWQAIAPEAASPGLTQAQAELLGIGLALARSPAVARAPGFAQQAQAWRARAAAEPPAVPGRLPEAPETSFPITREPGDGKDAPAPAMQADRARAARPGRPAAVQPPRTAPLAPVLPGDPGAASTAPAPGPAGAPEDDPEALVCATHYGGLFFLVNLAIRLGLYHDFTRPAEPGLPLALGDFLRLVGRCLLGPGLVRDPVWSLLGTLSGSKTLPGGRVPPPGGALPDEWRLPPAWLEPFALDGPLRWRVCGGRLRVFHPAGFLVLDVPRRGALARQMAREMGVYGDGLLTSSLASRRGRIAYARKNLRAPGTLQGVRWSSSLRWAAWLSAYLRAWLALALQTGPHTNPARLLAALDARVRLTATHLDVYFDLNRLPIQVRLAGLDRDPWWSPAAGRYIAFHFDV